MKITLQLPPKILHPNGGKRNHYGKVHRTAQKYKSDCAALASQIRPKFTDKDIHLSIVFHPRTRHAVDRDNMIASFKYGQDGIALAWKVDDSRFVPHYAIGDPVKGGSVVVEVMQ